jgi:hypothetical protein
MRIVKKGLAKDKRITPLVVECSEIRILSALSCWVLTGLTTVVQAPVERSKPALS